MVREPLPAECRLEVEEALVEGRGILAIQGDHRRPRLATADDLERIMFYSFDLAAATAHCRWFAR